MNRRKKEADQHKGWNISISGVFIAMVMGIVLISVVAATLIFVQIYRNAMEQSAVTSSSQSCEQVQNTVENYTQDMRIILEGIVARMRHENNHSEEYIQNLVNIRSDVVAVTICGEDGELLRYWNRGQKLKENYRIVQSTEMEDDDGRLRITKPYVESLFEGYYPWVVTVYQKIQKEDGTSIQVNIDIRFSDIANYVDDVGYSGNQGICIYSGCQRKYCLSSTAAAHLFRVKRREGNGFKRRDTYSGTGDLYCEKSGEL